MIVDKGSDFPADIESKLLAYGPEMWLFRERRNGVTTRALNSYRGELRGFEYLTPRQRLTPRDLLGTKLQRPKSLHFICSPTRALAIASEIREVDGWKPLTIYEPIPDRCVPEELPSLIEVLPDISILSPNAEEAHSLLSMALPVTRDSIEKAAKGFLDLGVDQNGMGAVIIRSGHLGSYVTTRKVGGLWVEAFWNRRDPQVVDVTGAGNSFLGGLAAGLELTGGDIFEATLYASISASFTIEQAGLPILSDRTQSWWNDDSPLTRLEELRKRVGDRPYYVCT
ncbi:hypothetical protein AX16_000187 [Volvariella volvacea WC 439]|nr:hypothetical protein AX16_000187 [Volvariella volvacea WC 439]